jgi:hypothetical protein
MAGSFLLICELSVPAYIEVQISCKPTIVPIHRRCRQNLELFKTLQCRIYPVLVVQPRKGGREKLQCYILRDGNRSWLNNLESLLFNLMLR